MIKEHPILFSAELVKANLDGTKTMTRRIMNPQPDVHPNWEVWKKEALRKYKYQVGDLLWVRETWMELESALDPNIKTVYYKADNKHYKGKWKSPRFMFKKFARIWLEITNIKIERLHDISREDATNEGLQREWDGTHHWYKLYITPSVKNPEVLGMTKDQIAAFKSLWVKINKEESWNENPFVWVIEYKLISKTGKP